MKGKGKEREDRKKLTAPSGLKFSYQQNDMTAFSFLLYFL